MSASAAQVGRLISKRRAPRPLLLVSNNCSSDTGKVLSQDSKDNGGSQHTAPRRVVVCGGGVIGASITYYLSLLGVGATIVEKEAVACAASGKGAGFLALDWNDQSALGPLSRKSYALHAELAQALGQDIGYRPLHTLQLSAKEGAVRSAKTPSWLDGPIVYTTRLGSPETTAQVHPQKLTLALIRSAEQRGASVVYGSVEGINLSPDNIVNGVLVGGEVLEADAVVVAMGPWSSQVAAHWLPIPDILGQKYHSIVLQPAQPVNAYAGFTSTTTAAGTCVEVEIYPRPDGTVYVCGEAERERHVDVAPGEVTVEEQRCARINSAASTLSTTLRKSTLATKQSCYLPWSPDGLPVIGKLPGVEGAYIATGHGCWGILNGPATGLALAELIVHGKERSVSLRRFDPKRFC